MDLSMGVVLLLVTGFLWVSGAILHWHNIRRQEKLLLRMRRVARRRPHKPAAAALPAGAGVSGEALRPAKRWTV
jgi:hypothetical protein